MEIILYLIIAIVISIISITQKNKNGNYTSVFKTKEEIAAEKGKIGEINTLSMLNDVFGYHTILQNLYLPMSNGKTTEIDIILITCKGIFVIENKNYSGWIFGSLGDTYWTQTFPDYSRYKFYNPVIQNKTHINILKKYINLSKNYIYSFIVFSNNCELKKVPEDDKNLSITYQCYMVEKINKIMFDNTVNDVLTIEQINAITESLIKYTNVSDKIKKEHIENINVNIPYNIR